MARPVSTYRLLALDAGGGLLGLTAASFALPPMFLGVAAGRWTERHHPGVMLGTGMVLTSIAVVGLVATKEVGVIAAATMLLGIGHMASAIGGQSLMARAHSDVPRLTRFGIFTTSSALGQVLGPVTAGLIIGQSAETTVASTSDALVVAGLVVVVGLVPALLALRARMRASTMRVGRAERVWGLLRVRGMIPALSTSFSAKGAVDLLLVYMPVLGLALGLSPKEVGFLLGVSAGGALAARAATPLLVRRTSVVRLTTTTTTVAALCVLALPASSSLGVLVIVSAVLGLALGLAQTTTLDWVVALVDDTSRGSALGLRLATNRLGQALVVGAAGLVIGVLGVSSAFVILGAAMLLTAAAGAFSQRSGQDGDLDGRQRSDD